jgi:hypothetical protein
MNGTSVHNYTKSADTWTQRTNENAFVEKFKQIANDDTITNENRADAIERFLL